MSETDCPAMRRKIEDGERRIECATERGRDVANWETFWLELLKAYETLCADICGDPPMVQARVLRQRRAA